MSSWMLREKNSEEVLTEIRIPGWTGRETFLGLLDNIHFCTHFPDSVYPMVMMEKVSYVMEAEGQKHLSPTSPEHLPEASLTLGKTRSQREICLSVSDLWCGLCTRLCGWTHVCGGQRTTVSVVSTVLYFQTGYLPEFTDAAMNASQWASGICLSPVSLWYGHRHTLTYMSF